MKQTIRTRFTVADKVRTEEKMFSFFGLIYFKVLNGREQVSKARRGARAVIWIWAKKLSAFIFEFALPAGGLEQSAEMKNASFYLSSAELFLFTLD